MPVKKIDAKEEAAACHVVVFLIGYWLIACTPAPREARVGRAPSSLSTFPRVFALALSSLFSLFFPLSSPLEEIYLPPAPAQPASRQLGLRFVTRLRSRDTFLGT